MQRNANNGVVAPLSNVALSCKIAPEFILYCNISNCIRSINKTGCNHIISAILQNQNMNVIISVELNKQTEEIAPHRV